MSSFNDNEEDFVSDSAADFIQISTETSKSGSITDNVVVGDLQLSTWDFTYVAGEAWPNIFRDEEGNSTFDIEVTQRYRFSTGPAVRSQNPSPSQNHWRINEAGTVRDVANRRLFISLERSKEYEGVAKIGPGESVAAKIAFSPFGARNVTW